MEINTLSARMHGHTPYDTEQLFNTKERVRKYFAKQKINGKNIINARRKISLTQEEHDKYPFNNTLNIKYEPSFRYSNERIRNELRTIEQQTDYPIGRAHISLLSNTSTHFDKPWRYEDRFFDRIALESLLPKYTIVHTRIFGWTTNKSTIEKLSDFGEGVVGQKETGKKRGAPLFKSALEKITCPHFDMITPIEGAFTQKMEREVQKNYKQLCEFLVESDIYYSRRLKVFGNVTMKEYVEHKHGKLVEIIDKVTIGKTIFPFPNVIVSTYSHKNGKSIEPQRATVLFNNSEIQ